VKTKMINEIIGKFCPTTIMLNIGAIGIGMTETEQGLKIVSYLVAIIWTTLKIINEIRIWKKKK
tara:strand:+ start:2866 stop:3057 length:192 start_codon:yes stop_codon:yes gene_type:complete